MGKGIPLLTLSRRAAEGTARRCLTRLYTFPKAGLLNHPTDVAVDPDGDIYVTDWGNSIASPPKSQRSGLSGYRALSSCETADRGQV